jgi:hypothetical protein
MTPDLFFTDLDDALEWLDGRTPLELEQLAVTEPLKFAEAMQWRAAEDLLTKQWDRETASGDRRHREQRETWPTVLAAWQQDPRNHTREGAQP